MTMILEKDPLATLVGEIDCIVNGASGNVVCPQSIQAVVSASISSHFWLTSEQCRSNSDNYARHILHADKFGRYTVAALVWKSGQFSPVHAHKTWCALAVARGRLHERYFKYEPAESAALYRSSREHALGSGSCGAAGTHLVHQLGNPWHEDAISIHVYGVDSQKLATGVNQIMKLAVY